MRLVATIALALIASPALFAQESWTPYVAQYRQVMTEIAPDGQSKTTEMLGEEKRSSDGSLLRTVIENGTPARGDYWDSKTGRFTRFNYIDKHGYQAGVAPRKHSNANANPDNALGTQEIAGVVCTGYPSHVGNDPRSSGTVWVDDRDDVLMKNEIHDFFKGHEIVQTREITTISFVEPDPESMKIPEGIQIDSAPALAR